MRPPQPWGSRAPAAWMAVVVAITAVACGVPPGALDSGVGEPNPTYTDHVAPILAAHCTRCHDPATRLAAGVDLSTHQAARSTRVSTVCTAVGPDVVDVFADHLHPLGGTADRPCQGMAIGSMPPGAQPSLSLDDQMTLARWVAHGAPED